jgi:ABC-type lipoprotein release transport system permease subunit
MNGSIGLVARSQLRRRGRAVVLLTLFVGVLGGLAISLVAGSRRSATVVDRYFAAGIPYDLGLTAPSLSRDDLLAIPGVTRADMAAYIGAVRLTPDGRVDGGVNTLASDFTSIDPTIEVLDGVAPDGTDQFQVLVNEFFVDQFGLTTGDAVELQMFGLDQEQEVSNGVYEPDGPRYTFHIAGVVRTPMDIAIDKVESPDHTTAYADANMLAVPLRFYEEHRHEFLDFGSGYDIQLSDGPSGQAAFLAAVDELVADGGEVQVQPGRFEGRRDTLHTPVDLETTALLALGIGLAIGGVVAVALLLRAEQRAHDNDTAALRALGSTAPELGTTAAVRSLPVAIGGAALAALVAVALSGRYPIGVGLQLELDRGVDVNVAVVVGGAALLAVLVVGLGFLLGWPRRRRSPGPPAAGTVAGGMARAGAPADVCVGTHFAFDRSRTARSPRLSILAGAATLVIMVTLAMLVGGIDRLYRVSAEHGWPWDVAIGNINFPLAPEARASLTDDPRIAAQTAALYGQATVGGVGVEILGVDEGGTAPPSVVSGRLPASAREIAVAGRLLRRLGLDVGDTVPFSIAGTDLVGEAPTTDLDLTIVGVTLVPVLGEADMGESAVVTLDALEATGGISEPNLVLARLRGDPPATAAELDRDLTQEIMTDSTPARIVNLYRVQALPILGIVLAGALGTAILVSAIALSVRSRRHDLSVLRALGLAPRRLGRVLAWQGIALAATTLLIGVPLGLLAGTLLWSSIADQLGVRDDPVVTPLLVLLVPASLLVAVVASLSSARRARRLSVAAMLRAE